MEELNFSNLPHLDCQNGRETWPRWKRSFELYVESKGITDTRRKRAMLLHHGGIDLQDIFFNLPESEPPRRENSDTPETIDLYEYTIELLDRYFESKANIPFERHLFRSLEQKAYESMDQFVLRLRKQGKRCNFANINDEIRDQIVQKCYSKDLRIKLLDRPQLTLEEAINVSHAFETLRFQTSEMENKTFPVHKISEQRNVATKQEIRTCYRCGRKGHIGNDKSCPALSKKCSRCGKTGHFQKCCKTNIRASPGRKRVYNLPDPVAGNETVEGLEYFTFQIDVNSIGTSNDNSKIQCDIGGVKLTMLIDSGAGCNVIDQQTWEFLKTQKIKCLHNTPLADKHLRPYGSENPIPVIGKFTAVITIQDKSEVADTFVINGRGPPLLGRDTASKLGVLRMGLNAEVNQIATSFDRPCFENKIGKLKDFQVQIPLKEDVAPISQSYRRIPIPCEKLVEKKLEELISNDIIEPVEGPSNWVSPIVPVRTGNKEERSCQLVQLPNPPEPMERKEMPENPWEELAIDILGPLPSGDYIFVVVDYHSRYIEAEPIKDISGETIINKLGIMFARFGLPKTLTTDNAKQFVGEPFENFCKDNDIVHLKVIPYWPQANGEVERQNRSLLKRLRIAQANNQDWREELVKFLFMSRTTPHTVTGVSPAELMFGRKLRDKLPSVNLDNHPVNKGEIRDRDRSRKHKGKVYADRKRRAKKSNIREGDLVLMKQMKTNKLTTNFNPVPMKVEKIKGPKAIVRAEDGRCIERHLSFFKKFYQDETS